MVNIVDLGDLETAVGRRHFSITPNDSADLQDIPKALWVENAGDLALRDRYGVDQTYSNVQGLFVFVRPVRVLATGTTASGIIGTV